MEKRQLLSDLDKNTIFHHTLGLKSTVAPCKIVDEYALTPFVDASKAVLHLAMHEIRSGLSESTRAFFGSWVGSDSMSEVVDFAGELNNQFESVSRPLCFLDPSETFVASVRIGEDLFGSVDDCVSCTA